MNIEIFNLIIYAMGWGLLYGLVIATIVYFISVGK